jgi:hypothetical protein
LLAKLHVLAEFRAQTELRTSSLERVVAPLGRKVFQASKGVTGVPSPAKLVLVDVGAKEPDWNLQPMGSD